MSWKILLHFQVVESDTSKNFGQEQKEAGSVSITKISLRNILQQLSLLGNRPVTRLGIFLAYTIIDHFVNNTSLLFSEGSL